MNYQRTKPDAWLPYGCVISSPPFLLFIHIFSLLFQLLFIQCPFPNKTYQGIKKKKRWKISITGPHDAFLKKKKTTQQHRISKCEAKHWELLAAAKPEDVAFRARDPF